MAGYVKIRGRFVCAGGKVRAQRQGGVAFNDDVASQTRSSAAVAFDMHMNMSEIEFGFETFFMIP